MRSDTFVPLSLYVDQHTLKEASVPSPTDNILLRTLIRKRKKATTNATTTDKPPMPTTIPLTPTKQRGGIREEGRRIREGTYAFLNKKTVCPH